ncbi:heme ABC exporter, ATP-binding protein CcmA [Desulfitobacterium dichloroeliminans LMG P-21439]|uniref:Heme ABC exporter, ATP-binding protein CcmA n=1 Tax=Desulfitobacterium dichloroeliminans (strain LMG P-21439 / DCA1) TaxID=871963 RepID=L0F6T3_DESDL|nr:heme ABC exporter ATP-binding protein CcmA [Desulfitobacterium dichloroeliminans]AGA68663.1 heme ABC exporter, ATP-binding protein CcmA [Desulfitobacterium dichloroeliminans LMG P-21439]
MIVAEGLTKKIGTKEILKGIDLEIHDGEFVTCFGPNGAGKSTTLNILALLSKPSGGNLWIDGQDTKENTESLRSKIGVISHNSFLYNNLTAQDNLEFYARMYQVSHPKARVSDLLERVGLTYAANELVGAFSRGMQQRLSIARSLIHKPSILLLDEPYTGLDERAKHILNTLLAQISQNKRTIFLITHDFEQGLAQSNKSLILVGGRIVYRCNSKDIDRVDFRKTYLEYVGGAA